VDQLVVADQRSSLLDAMKDGAVETPWQRRYIARFEAS
jgi:hypothetical protein